MKKNRKTNSFNTMFDWKKCHKFHNSLNFTNHELSALEVSFQILFSWGPYIVINIMFNIVQPSLMAFYCLQLIDMLAR